MAMPKYTHQYLHVIGYISSEFQCKLISLLYKSCSQQQLFSCLLFCPERIALHWAVGSECIVKYELRDILKTDSSINLIF